MSNPAPFIPSSIRQFAICNLQSAVCNSLIVAVCLLGLALPSAVAADDEAPSELQPYRVLVSVSFPRDASLTPAYRRDVFDRLADRARRTLGGMWELTLQEDATVVPPGVYGLRRLTAGTVRQTFEPIAPAAEKKGDAQAQPNRDRARPVPFRPKYDKIFFVAVTGLGPDASLAVREWDSASWRLTDVHTARLRERRELPETILSACLAIFDPVLTVEQVIQPTPRSKSANGRKQKQPQPERLGDLVVLRLRAGSFPAIDPAAAQLRPGDVLTPFFRYYDENYVPQRVQVLPWTYLYVDRVDRGFVDATLISALRMPLGTGRLRRAEIMAFGLKRRLPSSRLKMVLQGRASRPLVGHRVEIVAKRHYKEEAKSEPIRLYSSREGAIDVPVRPEFPIQWIYIYSGRLLLARVPYVAGVNAADTLEVPDDALRLGVEGALERLKAELVEVVARRAALIILANALADKASEMEDAAGAKEQWKEVDRLLAEADGLPGLEEFERRLRAVQLPAEAVAEKNNNAFIRRRIRRLCEETGELCQRYLAGSQKLQLLREEIGELRKNSRSKGKSK